MLKIVGKQITNYQELAKLENDRAIARTNVIVTNKGTAEHRVVQTELNEVENKYNLALETEKTLIEERKSIHVVKAEQDVTLQGHEKNDDRREERVNEVEEKRRTLAEYKGRIADTVKNEGAKVNDLRDREVTKQQVIPSKKDDR